MYARARMRVHAQAYACRHVRMHVSGYAWVNVCVFARVQMQRLTVLLLSIRQRMSAVSEKEEGQKDKIGEGDNKNDKA